MVSMTLRDRLALDGRVVVVAGAGGGGIGTEVCRAAAEAGALVAAIDIDAARLALAEHAVAGAGSRCLPIVADAREPAQVAGALDEAVSLGPLFGLVHVAGGTRPEQWAPVSAGDVASFDAVVDLNLRAPYVTSSAVAARLVEQGTGGSIVHLASIAGLSAMPFVAGYAAAKAGVLALTRTMAVELGRHGVRVNAVAAGTIRTPKNRAESTVEDTAEERAAIPLGRRGLPADVAGAVLFLLSDLAAYLTGHTLVVDGGSSVRPSFLGPDDLPVFVHDDALRARLLGEQGFGVRKDE
jgi:3-oxoacyl-[acyl-carrier protein] reductase